LLVGGCGRFLWSGVFGHFVLGGWLLCARSVCRCGLKARGWWVWWGLLAFFVVCCTQKKKLSGGGVCCGVVGWGWEWYKGVCVVGWLVCVVEVVCGVVWGGCDLSEMGGGLLLELGRGCLVFHR